MKQGKPAPQKEDQPLDPAKRRTLQTLAALGLLAVGGDFSLSRLAAFGATSGRSSPGSGGLHDAAAGANVVICVIDAARADHFGCYGYPRKTTPNADLLAQESLVFDNHFCQDTWTPASTASLFTGQHPDTHLAFGYRPVPPSSFSIEQALEGAGFQTALFSSNAWASPLGNKGLDFQTAYSTRDALRVAQEGEAWHSPEALLRVFRKWLQEHHCARFYCYLHFIPPHMPYPSDKDRLAPFKGKKPPGYRSERYHPGEWDFPLPPNTQHHPPLPEWINLYDANLRYGDWAASEVLRLLREVGVQEKTIFVLTSDHGEAFGEHGFVFHDRCPYDEVARIPLLIRFPNAARTGRIGGLSQSIDILPTFCDLFGISYPEIKVQGQSLLPIIAGAQDKVHDYIFTHAYLDRDKYLVRGLDHALVLYGTDNRRELYALKSDQEQRRNVIGGNPKKAGQMVEAFRKFAQRQRWDIMYIIDPDGTYAERPRDMPGKPVPEDTKKQLEALGYL